MKWSPWTALGAPTARDDPLQLRQLAQFHAKQRRYARIEGQILADRGVKPWPHKFVRFPLQEFWRRYVALEGYKDGWIGLKLAVLLGFYYGFVPHGYLVRKTENMKREK